MRLRSIFLTVCVLAVIVMMAADSSAQSAPYKIYGYISVGGAARNGIVVTLAGTASGQYTTVDNGSHAGYYEFFVGNGQYTVSATNGTNTAMHSSLVNGHDVRIDLDISTATPTPTPGPSPTPTPVPSHDPGGVITRNDSSSFIPMSANGPTVPASPRPSRMPTAGPTIAPTPTPRPTQAPAPGIFSNIYLWLVVALVAILAIAAATLYLLRR